MGPVEYLIVEFPGNKFNGEIVPALADLTNSGIIKIIDLLFIKKHADGSVESIELNGLAPAEAAPFDAVDGEVNDLFNQEDIALAAEKLQPNSSAALLVYENVWSTTLRNAIVNAHGRLVDSGRIPAAVIEAAMAAGQ
jgi:hypothetical protein